MDGLRMLAEARGFFTRGEAAGEGFDDKSIARVMRCGLWVRIRHGYYTFSDLWTAADEVRRHRVRARCVLHRLGDRVALSHVSAALEHDLTVWDIDLSLVHVTRLDGGPGRTEAGIHFHEGSCGEDELVELDGMQVVNRTRAALETCSGVPAEHGLVVLDSLLHKGGSVDELKQTHEAMLHWPGMQHVQVPVRMADGRAESAGETRTRWLCYKHHLPAPNLQFEVRDHNGDLVGTTDFEWQEHGLLGEFDGKIKYGRLLRDGEEPGDAVFREKVREDAVRDASGCRMVRFVWRDLYRDVETAARIRRNLRGRAA